MFLGFKIKKKKKKLFVFQLVVVKQEDKLELIFKHFLVEDKNNSGGASYVDFLCHMHKEIRTLLS